MAGAVPQLAKRHSRIPDPTKPLTKNKIRKPKPFEPYNSSKVRSLVMLENDLSFKENLKLSRDVENMGIHTQPCVTYT